MRVRQLQSRSVTMPRLTDRDEIRARLERDRAWGAFSLADLAPPYDVHAAWFGPSAGESVVLVYGAYDPPLVVCHGPAAECDALLSEPDVVRLTPRGCLSVTASLLPIAERHFTRFQRRRMVRMLLASGRCASVAAGRPVSIGADALDDVRRLYAEDPPAFFLPAQLKDGVYFGVREGSELIAIAGTHVVSPATSVAAIGNVYTRRDRRRQGLALEVTSAVIGELRRAGITTIVLNIVATNTAARRVYERIGFSDYCEYYEGAAIR